MTQKITKRSRKNKESEQTTEPKITQLKLDDIKVDEKIRMRVSPSATVTRSYADAMLRRKEFPPVVIFNKAHDYWLADGFYRVAATRLIERHEIQAEIRPGGRRSAILYAVGANEAHGSRRNNSDKRLAVTTLLKDSKCKGWSDGMIAEQAGVTQPFVSKMRAGLTQNGYESLPVRVGADGRKIDTSKIGKTSRDAMPSSTPALATRALNQARANPATTAARAGVVKKSRPPKEETNEWYTPKHVAMLIHKVLDADFTDVASNGMANAVVNAKQYFTKEDNALTMPWHGDVYLNPPYSRTEIRRFVHHLIEQYEKGNVKQALLLVNSSTSSQWFDEISRCGTVMFFQRRLRFWHPKKKSLAGKYDSAIFYLGPNIQNFIHSFGEVARAPNLHFLPGDKATRARKPGRPAVSTSATSSVVPQTAA